jgi:hypothetical protein
VIPPISRLGWGAANVAQQINLLDERNEFPEVLVKHRRASHFAPDAYVVKYVFYVCKCLSPRQQRERKT